MKVVVTPEAQGELKDVWNWNAKERGVRHADSYLAFIDREIERLAKDYAKGKRVSTRSDLRYVQMRRKTKGNAHLAIYSIGEAEITVLHVFHSSQDWENKLAEE